VNDLEASKKAARQRCRRPIEDNEVPYLEAMGHRLRQLRQAAGMTLEGLARASSSNVRTIQRVEIGVRRTRRSTLSRWLEILTTRAPVIGDVDDLLDELCALAGPGLAPESEYRDRIERRRKRRIRKLERERAAVWAARELDLAQEEARRVTRRRPHLDPSDRSDRGVEVVHPEAAALAGRTWLDVIEEGAE
jgi:transcriptional regulator with XRE-family HTH domain